MHLFLFYEALHVSEINCGYRHHLSVPSVHWSLMEFTDNKQTVTHTIIDV